MALLELSSGNALAYDHQPPRGGHTFVFFNALTGDKTMWTGDIGRALQDKGHGYLAYNLRGQAGSAFTPGGFDEAMIVADAVALLAHVKPVRPIHVGLSIGGLFATKAHLAGATAEGLVYINTLRKPSPRLDWLNDALVRAAEVGGLELLRDLYLPLLFNEDWQAENRHNFLTCKSYQPIAGRDDGALALLKSGATADWDVNYEALDIPVLNITGLQDRVFYNASDVDELFARLPNAQRIDMADAGHMIPAERPEALVDALIGFADQIAPAS